jgi:protein SCO1/2
MATRVLAALLGAVLLVGLPACGRQQAGATDATAAAPGSGASVTLETFGFGGDFSLVDQRGQTFDLAAKRGRVHLLFFGFTNCPDVCPMTLSRIARAFNLLSPEQRAQVTTLFVSVDVDRDTPAALADYLRGFPVDVVGLTGTRAQVDRVVAQYKASYEITPSTSAGGPTVSHSTYTYLIDQAGKVRHLFRLADSPEQIAAGLTLLLR